MKNKKSTFNHEGIYICECGKEFTNSQSFNGHKCHCITHRQSNNTLIVWNRTQEMRGKSISESLIKRYEKNRIESFEKWLYEKHTCERCGKVMTEKFGSGRFCSRYCANSRKHTGETKRKTGASVLKTHNYRSNKPKCSICGKILRIKTKSGLCADCLHGTEYGLSLMSESGKIGYNTKVINGTHKPWASRNITSYAEKFWKSVLENNGIEYMREYSVKKGYYSYFLDFYIERNGFRIDLEIDGKQHNLPERIVHDQERDSILKDLGYIVYRVKWNRISTEDGKAEMKNKIDMFLDFYRNL